MNERLVYVQGVPITYSSRDFIPALLLYIPFLLISCLVTDEQAWWEALSKRFNSCFVRVKIKHVLPHHNDIYTPILWPSIYIHYKHYPAYRYSQLLFVFIFLVLLCALLTPLYWGSVVLYFTPLPDDRMIFHPNFASPVFQCHRISHPLSNSNTKHTHCITHDRHIWHYNETAGSVARLKQRDGGLRMVQFRDSVKNSLYYGYRGEEEEEDLLVEHALLIETLESERLKGFSCQCPPTLGIKERDLYFDYNDAIGEWTIMHEPRIYLNATLSGLTTHYRVTFDNKAGYPPRDLTHYKSFYVEYQMINPVWEEEEEEEEDPVAMVIEYEKRARNYLLLTHKNEKLEKRRHLFTGSSATCFVYCSSLFK